MRGKGNRSPEFSRLLNSLVRVRRKVALFELVYCRLLPAPGELPQRITKLADLAAKPLVVTRWWAARHAATAATY